MTYYDPKPWISTDDNLISPVEDILKLHKRAYSKRFGTGKSYLPQAPLELDIITDDKQILRLTEWKDKNGKIFIELAFVNDTYRKGHFNSTDWHHNPSGENIPPPHHIHFPTKKYSINQMHTYAFPIKADTDYISTLEKFCEVTNIEIKGVSIPLLRG